MWVHQAASTPEKLHARLWRSESCPMVVRSKSLPKDCLTPLSLKVYHPPASP